MHCCANCLSQVPRLRLIQPCHLISSSFRDSKKKRDKSFGRLFFTAPKELNGFQIRNQGIHLFRRKMPERRHFAERRNQLLPEIFLRRIFAAYLKFIAFGESIETRDLSKHKIQIS
jgi:hypothetical protein